MSYTLVFLLSRMDFKLFDSYLLFYSSKRTCQVKKKEEQQNILILPLISYNSTKIPIFKMLSEKSHWFKGHYN